MENSVTFTLPESRKRRQRSGSNPTVKRKKVKKPTKSSGNKLKLTSEQRAKKHPDICLLV